MDSLTLDSSKFHLVHYKNDQFVNIRFLLNHFNNTDTTSKSDFSITSKVIKINNFDFIWENQNVQSGIQGMDFDNIHVRKLNGEFSDFSMKNIVISSVVNQIAFTEQSGFSVDTLECNFAMNSDSMGFNGLKIITPLSQIYGRYSMSHGDFKYYSDYIEQVSMSGYIENVNIDFQDIIYFSDNLIGFNEKFRGSGKFEGTVSDFVASELDIKFRNRSVIRGRVAMKGIPLIDSTIMDIKLVNSRMNPEDLVALKLKAFSENLNIKLPDFVKKYDEAVINGRLYGHYYNFKSNIEVNGKNGLLTGDFKLEKKKDKEFYYTGNFKSKGLKLGTLFETNELGVLSSNCTIKGRGFTKNTLKADVKGAISELELLNYVYNNIHIDGLFIHEVFKGKIEIDDKSCQFNFLGELDLTKQEPRLAFVAEIDTLYPSRINLLERDSSVFISAKIDVDSKGDDIENFVGRLELKNFLYIEKEKNIDIPSLKFTSYHANGNRMLELKSTIGEGLLSGSYHIPSIKSYFESMIRSSLPALVENVAADSIPGDFAFNAEMYNLNPVFEIFYPSVEIDSNLFVSGLFDGPENSIDLKLTTNGFRYSGVQIDTLNFLVNHKKNSIVSEMNIKSLSLDKDIFYRNIYVKAEGVSDTLSVIIKNDNETKPEFKSDISFGGVLLGPEKIHLAFDSSYVVLADSIWVLNSHNLIEMDSNRWAFDSFNLVSNHKKINLSGAISEDTSDVLKIILGELNLANFTKIVGINEAQLDGNISGDISLSKLYFRPEISSSIYVNDLSANGEYIGSGPINSSWNTDKKRFDVDFDLFRPADSAFIDTIRSIKFFGHYYPQIEDTSFHLKLISDGFKIKAIEPIVKEYITDISGELIGELDLTGSFKNPVLKGEMRLDSTQFKIVYLNTNYFAHEQTIKFREEWFGFDKLKLQDDFGKLATADGTVLHDNWKDFNYDVFIEMDTFLALNTNLKQNELFYGIGYLTGDVSVAGYENHLNLEIDAKVQNNSKLFVPLYSANEIAHSDYIHFVTLEAEENEEHLEKHEADLSGIDMKFDFKIDPSTEIQLIFDATSGEKLTAQGGGRIKTIINEEKDFEMYGVYEIRNGDYFFNFENIISKKFTLQQGGLISFNGDPLKANMDVIAQYKVKAGLQEILGDSAYSQKVDNLCLMHLTDQLSEPNLGFDIKVLNVDADIESRVKSQMPTQEDVNKQVFSLMLFNKYSPPENSLSGSGFAGTTTSELLTSQINSWLSKMDNKVVTVGVSELKQDNVEVELSKQMMDNRLVFESNVGVDNSQNNTNTGAGSQFVGDFKLEYMIREDGKIRAKVFNRSETYRIEDQGNSASQTQGIGIFFQEDYESYGQLLKKYFNNSERKAKRKKRKEDKKSYD